MIPRLKLGGYYYTYHEYFSLKSNARARAKFQRSLGYKARVVHQGNKWSVYVRG